MIIFFLLCLYTIKVVVIAIRVMVVCCLADVVTVTTFKGFNFKES